MCTAEFRPYFQAFLTHFGDDDVEASDSTFRFIITMQDINRVCEDLLNIS